MPAVIESTLYTAPPSSGGVLVAGSTQQNSREDLQLGYHVALRSVHTATTYSWTLAFASDSPGAVASGFDGTPSTSALLPPEGSTSRDASFNVDYEGTYLIRLVVDAGLATEDTQFIRLRLLTIFGSLKLVAAGERRDALGVIPVDATPEGWANDQNANIQRLALLIRRQATTGRVLYVDANRGRSSGNDQDDYDNLIHLPGPDTSRVEETGMQLRAMGHGDFSSINEAISYALAAASRGEPAPSLTQPYFILVKPGLYIEDLAFASHVHIIGEVPPSNTEVATSQTDGGLSAEAAVIRTAITAGTGTHRYSPQADFTGDKVLIKNLVLETIQDTTQPVLDVQGGLLEVRNCIIHQKGNAVAQGAALNCVVNNPAYAPQVLVYDSHLASDATTATRQVVRFDAPDSTLLMSRCVVTGQVGIEHNESMYETSFLHVLDQSSIVGFTQALSSYGHNVLLSMSSLSTPLGIPVRMTPFGVNAGAAPATKTGDASLWIQRCFLTGPVEFSTAAAAGTTTILLASNDFIGVAEAIQLPDAPGDLPDNYLVGANAETLGYQADHHSPLEGIGAADTVPLANQLPVTNVQEAIDLLVRVAMPTAGSPFYSLDTAYDGLASLSPFLAGTGLGRHITANAGAVVIQGASYPLAIDGQEKNGGLQVAGMVDIGGVINGAAGENIIDVGHSEIGLIPDLIGTGPYVGLGRARWDTTVTQANRGFGSASIVSGISNSPSAPSSNAPYHLHLRSSYLRSSGTGAAGNVYLVAGGVNDPVGTDTPGEVHIVAGFNARPLGSRSSIYLAPGVTGLSGGTPGEVVFTGAGARQPATLTFDNPYVGGVAGTLYLGTPHGAEALEVTGAETLAALTSLINTTARMVLATDDGTTLSLHSEASPAGDVRIIGDSTGGTLITAFGGPTTTFTPGTYGDQVTVDVPTNGRLRVNGDLEVTGVVIGASPAITYITVDHTILPTATSEVYSVKLSATVDITITLDATLAQDTYLTIKDQNGIANAIPSPVGQKIIVTDGAGGTFDGGANLEITTNYGAVTIYKNDAGNWSIL